MIEQPFIFAAALCRDPEGDYCRGLSDDEEAQLEAWYAAQPDYPDVDGVEQMRLPLFTLEP